MQNARRTMATALLATTMAVGLAACGSDEGGTADESVTIGMIPPWSDTRVAAALMTYKAEELGFDVSIEEMNEPPMLFAAVANGDVDIYPSAWADRNHKAFIDEYGDDLEVMGSYYDGAINFLAVPEYSEMQSIADIEEHWDELGQRIVGIEAGAGLTAQMINDVLPAYGFSEDDLLTSSTTAMLAELESAINREEEIVVTLWSPYWASSEYDVRPLEDPEGAFGESEDMHYVATGGFGEAHPDLQEWVDGFSLNEEQFASLENLILNEYEEGEEMEALDEWLETYPDAIG